MKRCVYCGQPAQCRDHVTPVSYLRVYRNYNPLETVPCCHSCNTLAGDFVAFSIKQKATFLLPKYRRILNLSRQPRWRESELDELDHGLKDFINNKMSARKILKSQILNLSRVCKLKVEPEFKSCLCCNKKFKPSRDWSKFCSYACRQKEHYKKKGRPLIKEESSCQQCGATYIKRRAWAKFCSRKCRMDHHYENSPATAKHNQDCHIGDNHLDCPACKLNNQS